MKEKQKLVIVESPSKAKTIEKYLGKGYVVKASMGHLRDLPTNSLGVDLERDFEPDYRPMYGKEKIIKELKSSAQNAEMVYLATDPDREGEAISWHLKYLLDLNDGNSCRVTFNEITKKVVQSSISQPRKIDQDLVDAQQARRVLDRLVGYQVSPVLWKKVRKGLSAGRVQSVAVRLVVDRENEIRAFVPQEYWELHALLQNGNTEVLAEYVGKGKKEQIRNENQADSVISDVENGSFTVSSVKNGEKKRSAQPPFNTSSLQQEASRKLGLSPKRTMAIAQQLYEGLEIGGIGAVGLITYMRTDSLRLSDEAMSAAKDYICSTYGAEYHYGSFHRYKTKTSAQDAHEAIRPSDLSLTPERVSKDLNRDQLRLYRLIWSRFLASQMSSAQYRTQTTDFTCNGHLFRSSSQVMTFQGYTILYDEAKETDEQKSEGIVQLPNIMEGDVFRALKIEKEQHFTQPPARYTEASLIRTMEENGVGRPSTYATIISTIQDRDYVEKKGRQFFATILGETVNSFLSRYFKDIVDVEFTANMEKQLDDIEGGSLPWKKVMAEFYENFRVELVEAASGDHFKIPDEKTDEICELCGRNMVIKMGRFGRFLACSGFPECKNTRALVEKAPGRCVKCDGAMLKKKSKKGYTYYACEHGPECDFLSWEVPTSEDCPVCGKSLYKRSGKGKMTPFCINPSCEKFLPEEKRGYYKIKAKEEGSNHK